ncbi:hypothetical protein I601_3356 [Nocardioides dokdonensis FR1436]|uniref:Uncharacterized protein n=1 Tax=Nocardioides dokdonensis FR1436 TaxID=1300347 RepID=A0A1A9GQ34_9ACTN|nr:hypothetical protein [Nocardioides dokdonensis]ANH39762.1 hypothetical protein I601_3356 [Nocardioides dokdonensis FR1436]
MAPSPTARTSIENAVGHVRRRARGPLRLGLRVSGQAVRALRPHVERGVALVRERGRDATDPSTSGPADTSDTGTSTTGQATAGAPTPADVAARVAPRPDLAADSESDVSSPADAPGDRLPPRRSAPAPTPVRPADS